MCVLGKEETQSANNNNKILLCVCRLAEELECFDLQLDGAELKDT